MGEREMIERLHDAYGSLTPGAIDRAVLEGMAPTIKEPATTIASLSEALAEAEKKGAEALHHIQEHFPGAAAEFEAVYERTAPPRDLSQGGQHG